MNTVEHAESTPVEHNDEAVAEYLQANPDFFARNSELLADLQLPHSPAPQPNLVPVRPR